ncbi:hypothetical protein [Nocardia sp. NPDC051832]|uniref:hypothetical protein n=1 Tax=Nocardia sp. NPDC051832 TaxID=3155673 RepID=UPI00342D2BDD
MTTLPLITASASLLAAASVLAGHGGNVDVGQRLDIAQAQQTCHSSYDPCVPVTSDVDCANGNGDGPAYTGPVRVIGPDVYNLDDNGNGVGCEAV